MIIFGTGSLLIKRFSPADLNISKDETGDHITYEVKQKYVHIFWIPVFPIDKIWIMRQNGTKQAYELPKKIQYLIENEKAKEIKTPITSWVFLLLIALGLTLSGLGKLTKGIFRGKFKEQGTELMQTRIDYPVSGDYYTITNRNIYHNQSKNGGTTILKVLEDKGDSVEVISINEGTYVHGHKSSPSFSNFDYFDAFDQVESREFNKRCFKKSDLKAAITGIGHDERNFSSWKSSDGKINFLGDYKISKIDRRDYSK